MTGSMFSTVFFLTLAAVSGAASAQTLKNLAGKDAVCARAESDSCSKDACATKCGISLTLPPGASYAATHYFTTADAPFDRGDVYETETRPVAGGRFLSAVHAPNQNHEEVVTVYYYNRANRDRKIAITVDYR